MIPESSIEYPGTRRFDSILEYSNFRVIAPSIRVLKFIISLTVSMSFQHRNENFNYQILTKEELMMEQH